MLDLKRREFIALVGAGGLLLAVKVKRAWGQQPAMPVIGFLGGGTQDTYASYVDGFRRAWSRPAGSRDETQPSSFTGWKGTMTRRPRWRSNSCAGKWPSLRSPAAPPWRWRPKRPPRPSRLSSPSAVTQSNSDWLPA